MFGLCSVVSCSDMLETDNDSMVINPGLDSKTDSVFYALGIAQAMQQLADQYFFIGEMRGELVTTTTHTDNNLRQLADYSADASNKYDSAYVYYKVINNCNYYLAHRDTALYTGSTNVTINEYAAVAAWRAWAYLQLARTYGGNETGIPFFTKPLTAISEIKEENFPKLTLNQIVAELAPGLEKFSGLAVPDFGGYNIDCGANNWSGANKSINPRLLFIPVNVILGEMYLEDGQYERAAQHYCKYLADNRVVLGDWQTYRHAFVGGLSDPWNNEELVPDFHSAYNSRIITYSINIFSATATPWDVVTYIPMAVSSQRGKTTDIPLAFGYDYYSTDRNNNCPRVDEIQVVPSKTYHTLTDSCDFYYYPENLVGSVVQQSPAGIAVAKFGDGRACFFDKTSSSGMQDNAILNYDPIDTTKVYIGKNRLANIYLMRESTIYLHLAEAFNRMGYPDAAFAVLRNGISPYLEQLVPGAGEVWADYQYMTPEAINMLSTTVPFLNATNRTIFLPEETFGIHSRGGGFCLNGGVENNMTVKGSQATAVGSKYNIFYLPKPIIGAKLAELEQQFGITSGATKEDSINAMEDILCDEYAKEFAFEGTRFYDLQRLARHKNESGIYGGGFGSKWFAAKLAGNNPVKDLTDPKNWYLPMK